MIDGQFSIIFDDGKMLSSMSDDVQAIESRDGCIERRYYEFLLHRLTIFSTFGDYCVVIFVCVCVCLHHTSVFSYVTFVLSCYISPLLPDDDLFLVLVSGGTTEEERRMDHAQIQEAPTPRAAHGCGQALHIR